jgi:hypothetical protein
MQKMCRSEGRLEEYLVVYSRPQPQGRHHKRSRESESWEPVESLVDKVP